MKNRNLKLFPLLLAMPFALTTVACSSEGVTAENITLEECRDLFDEDAEEPAEDSEDSDMLAGDFDDDGDEDEDDTAIEERCEELIAEDDAAAEGGDGDGDGDMTGDGDGDGDEAETETADDSEEAAE